MTKEIDQSAKVKNWLYIIGASVAILVVFVGIVLAWGDLGNMIKASEVEATFHNETQVEKFKTVIADADDLETEGCKPSAKNSGDISLIRKDVEAIQKTQHDMRREQRAGFKEILERLPPPK